MSENAKTMRDYVADDAALLRAARRLSDINARECNINAEDNWKTYSEIYIRDAREILSAAMEPTP